MKKIFSLLLSVILSILGISMPGDDLSPVPEREGVPTQENIELFEKIFQSEIEWLASLQLENGAIPMTYTPNGEVKVNPYFADFAALGLKWRYQNSGGTAQAEGFIPSEQTTNTGAAYATASDGSFVRAIAERNGEDVAQVMAVIGTDCNGTVHERWQENLALALQLRERLNQSGAALCRPVSLRNASYNQEMARYSLLLEIGTAANSVKEAERAAAMVGEVLAELIYAR